MRHGSSEQKHRCLYLQCSHCQRVLSVSCHHVAQLVSVHQCHLLPCCPQLSIKHRAICLHHWSSTLLLLALRQNVCHTFRMRSLPWRGKLWLASIRHVGIVRILRSFVLGRRGFQVSRKSGWKTGAPAVALLQLSRHSLQGGVAATFDSCSGGTPSVKDCL